MKQILQNISNGQTILSDVPSPKPKKGNCIIQTSTTLVSAGTERMLVDFGKANWIQKARSQPDKVKMVLDKIKTDGLAPTLEAVRSKLDQPLPLGYCNVGTVLEPQDTKFKAGQRVVSNGHHAEVVRVPQNLIAAIPNNVSDESAAFTVIGAIALQGIRLIKPTLGETVVVTGLGLIGLMAVQILRANGCKVLGVDFDSKKCELARQFGAEVVDLSKGEDLVHAANSFSKGAGVDAVLITASSKSNEIIHQSATISRKRGRIVLVGVVGLELSRADFYEKELTFQVSCSYGPGRYDHAYEQKGEDYPLPFVRWTEQRNFEAVLDLMASSKINVEPLISHRFELSNAVSAYERLDDKDSLGIILKYQTPNNSEEKLTAQTVTLDTSKQGSGNVSGNGGVVFVGAGNYASRVLMPLFRKAGATLDTVVTSGGISSFHHGKKNGFSKASTNYHDALSSDSSSVVIATQHNLHAEQIVDALSAGKHVFVEKPLALKIEEVDLIEKTYKEKGANKVLMVGYNRRFAPHVRKMKELLEPRKSPKTFIMTMNAGSIPTDHWTQDPSIGGGRIIGEACHYIDLMRFLVGSKISSFTAKKIGDIEGVGVSEDKAIITLTFEDGSLGSIHYFANGGKAFPKERIEVFCEDGVLQLDNFRKLRGFGWKGFKKMSLWSQDKGQENCIYEFIKSVQDSASSPIPIEEIIEVAKVSIEIAQSLRSS
ncbi:MAG: zinc-binding dehydrogenase [Oceanospirillaceae bacterium]|nr:zinc-binding dehydrogenase [Oceanospirillaceae bacterium]